VWVDDTLVKCEKFSLPGKKALLDDTEIEVVLVDVTESPVERTKENKKIGIPAKRSATPKKHRLITKLRSSLV
jgi:hypothetical protein